MTPTRELLKERAVCTDHGSITVCKNAMVVFAPLAVKTTTAAKMIDTSRRQIYRLLETKHLRAVKQGVTLLILVDSLYEHIASLPPAVFGAERDTTAA